MRGGIDRWRIPRATARNTGRRSDAPALIAAEAFDLARLLDGVANLHRGTLHRCGVNQRRRHPPGILPRSRTSRGSRVGAEDLRPTALEFDTGGYRADQRSRRTKASCLRSATARRMRGIRLRPIHGSTPPWTSLRAERVNGLAVLEETQCARCYWMLPTSLFD